MKKLSYSHSSKIMLLQKIINKINFPLRIYRRNKSFKKGGNFYSQFLSPNDLCFDIGANIGNKTKLFNALGAKVITVEPQPNCMKILKKKFAKNSNITLIEAGVGETSTMLEMQICDERSAISSFSDKFTTYIKENYSSLNWTKKIKVNILTLDDLIKQYGIPKFCKIDVEGYELNILKGLSTPIPFFSFEFNSPFIEDTIDCLNELDKFNNIKYNLSIAESMEFVFDVWVDKTKIIDYLKKLKGGEYTSGDIYAKVDFKN